MVQPRIFAGTILRQIRKDRSLKQADLALMIGISPAYLSQLENDDRPLTPALIDRLRKQFPVEWQDIPADMSAELLRALQGAVNSKAPDLEYSTSKLRKIVEQFPDFAERFIQLSDSHRASIHQLEMLDDAIGADNIAGGRLPWEEVRDWFHNNNNYVDTLDRAAEALSVTLAQHSESPSTEQFITWLSANGIELAFTRSGPLRMFDRKSKTLAINSAKAFESVKFHLAWQIASTALDDEISSIAENADLRSTTARNLLALGLRNYVAGAIIMPYEHFRSTARLVRHDIDQLRHRFGSTFEQVCHRLSTLQRPGAHGIPMYFCRVDMAGNITKRHSATGLRFARFGGACPLWVVHEAVAVPDRIHAQLAEMPDGTRYVSIAKGLVKQTGSYTDRPRRYAVALGCEVDFAADFIYADELNLLNERSVTPLGVSCRICSRNDCDQRAFPPSDKSITIDLSERDIVPYRIVLS